ncbi:MAG: exopolysaccharide production protein, partial [Cryobacterium sp.]|nr:exopolysaccharide production protein [Cryobacterium sp.]
ALCMHALRGVIGWPGALAVLAALVLLAALSIAAQPERLEWRGVLPLSLLALVGLMALSVVWSQYTWATLGGAVYAIAFAALGLYIALLRDTIQVVRSIGNALRAILTTSLLLEILSGVIIDTPLRFLGIQGLIAEGGPIQGLAGTRNYLAFLGGLAVVSFWIEYRTRSVPRGLTIFSLAIAALTLVFARSPVAALALAAVLVAGFALVGLRRMDAGARRTAQAVLLVSAVAALAIAWVFRGRLIRVVDAGLDVTVRTSVWADLEPLIEQNPVQGWGWVGAWPTEVFPFVIVRDAFGNRQDSALNAYVDVTLQLGIAGLLVLITALGLALVRAWLVASERRSTVHVWPALTIVLLATTSVTESYLLTEGGLMLFVIAAVTAAQSRSWRNGLSGAS